MIASTRKRFGKRLRTYFLDKNKIETKHSSKYYLNFCYIHGVQEDRDQKIFFEPNTHNLTILAKKNKRRTQKALCNAQVETKKVLLTYL